MQLGSWKNPGLTANEFLGLIGKIVRCKCGLIMTNKRYLGEHKCAIKGQGYIGWTLRFSNKLIEEETDIDSETEHTDLDSVSESESKATNEE
jgi:hypothetical protein